MVTVNGYAPPPASSTLADLIDRYRELKAREPGKTKAATLDMLRADSMGKVKLGGLSALTVRDFVERRQKTSAGAVTMAGDLSTVSALLK